MMMMICNGFFDDFRSFIHSFIDRYAYRIQDSIIPLPLTSRKKTDHQDAIKRNWNEKLNVSYTHTHTTSGKK